MAAARRRRPYFTPPSIYTYAQDDFLLLYFLVYVIDVFRILPSHANWPTISRKALNRKDLDHCPPAFQWVLRWTLFCWNLLLARRLART